VVDKAGMETISVVGGIVYPRRRGPLARGRISWPFARLTLEPAGVTLSPRGWIRRGIHPITVPYEDVTWVERLVPPRWLHYAEGLRFRSRQEAWDRLYFSTGPDRIGKLVQALEGRGIEVR
jgi:hypothetical protein